MKGVYVSDCEGPISKNDNAFELTAHFVPKGDKLFTIISKYDDILVDIIKKPNYNAGDTLKLILPFLRAYDVTDEMMTEYSANHLLLISGSKETIKHVTSFAETFIVSTSYEHYIRALCKTIDLPFDNAYCTKLSINRYSLSANEKTTLKKIADEIASIQMMKIPASASSIKDFSQIDQLSISRLDEIFWKEIPKMCSGKMFSDVKPVGGAQKAEAIQRIIDRLGLPLSSSIYVGDSITDIEAFQLVRNNGGFTISFNGNGYAVKNAEIAVMAENNIVTAVLAEVFLKKGKSQALNVLENWNSDHLKNFKDLPVLKRFLSLNPRGLPKVQIVTTENMESLSKESSEYRKNVRGEAVGQLG